MVRKAHAAWILIALGACAGLRAETGYDLRPYLQFRLGMENSLYDFHEPAIGPAVTMTSPATEPLIGASAGTDIGRYLGVELAVDYIKTNLMQTTGPKAGDYAALQMLGQVRLRYPVWNDRLVPYALIGGGAGYGFFGGREDFTFIGHGSDWDELGVAGAGIEYFLADNVTFGIEAKYYFGLRPRMIVGTQPYTANMDALGISAGVRLYLDNLATGHYRDGDRPPARDTDGWRGYVAMRGGYAFLTAGGHEPRATIDDTSGPWTAAVAGLNFGRHWGAELSMEGGRAQIRSPGLGKITGYGVWSVAAVARYRWPLKDGRLSPYLLAGPGVGFAEGGDRDVPLAVSGFVADTDTTAIAVLGAGLDYFLAHNIAFNVELKSNLFFDTEVMLNGSPAKLKPESVSLTAGIRLYFF